MVLLLIVTYCLRQLHVLLLEYRLCVLLHLWQLHLLITRWKQSSVPTVFTLCTNFPLNYGENQIVTFHHICSEVLLHFKQVYTVLSGGNTVWVYTVWRVGLGFMCIYVSGHCVFIAPTGSYKAVHHVYQAETFI